MQNTVNLSTVDLFCGCGGLSQGFINAGYDIKAAVENWDKAIDCYSLNFKHPVMEIDLSKSSEAAMRIAKFSPSIIIGGPPCQDFSGAGHRCEGERAQLTVEFSKIVKQVNPAYFVMENVTRITASSAYDEAREILADAKYGLTEIVLNASLCGVPQRRKRFFCIGGKDAENDFLHESLVANQAKEELTIRSYFDSQDFDLEINHYYRHPRSYQRRGIFSVDEPSPTIRGVNRPKPETYERHPGDPVDPKGIRCLTSKERSLVQTFPYSFNWGNASSSVIEQMIGNAVPVNLAEYVARVLRNHIAGKNECEDL